MGDFNLPTISWSFGGVPTNVSANTDKSFLDCFTSLGLTQWIDEPTNIRASNTLDLFLTTESDRIVSSRVFPPFPNCDHCVILCSYVFQFKLPFPHANVSTPFWPKANFKQINRFLTTIDWDFELLDLSVNDAYNKFLSFITHLGENYVPRKVYSSSSQPYKTWEYKPPKALATSRRVSWNHYKQLRAAHGRNSILANDALQSFLNLNYQYRNYAIHKQISYEVNILENYCVKPKVFHSYIRGKKVGCPSVGPLGDADNLIQWYLGTRP